MMNGNAELRKTAYLALDLIGASIYGKDITIGDKSEDAMDSLFNFAKWHGITTLINRALRKQGVKNMTFVEAGSQALRRNILYKSEYERIAERFDSEGISYLVLKGMRIKDMYDSPFMREMSDIDLLVSGDADADRAKKIMSSLGYKTESFRKSNHDVYMKKPFYNVELHRSLLDGFLFPRQSAVLDGLWDRLTPVKGSCRMEAAIEDFYLTFILHAYKHYVTGGMGLRVLIDEYYFLKKYGGSMDMAYIASSLNGSGAEGFELSLRSMSQCFTTPEKLDSGQREFLDDFLFYGLYGSKSNEKNNILFADKAGKGKIKHIKERLVLPEARIQRNRFFNKHRKLVPVLAVYRPIKSVFTRPEKLFKEIRDISKNNSDIEK